MCKPKGRWVKSTHERATGWARQEMYTPLRRVWWEALKREIYGVVKSRGSKSLFIRGGLLSFLLCFNKRLL